MNTATAELLASPAVLAAAVVVLVVILILCRLSARTSPPERRPREAGLYPAPGVATDADVGRLLDAGEKTLAIKLYRELYRVDLKSATAAVEELGRAR